MSTVPDTRVGKIEFYETHAKAWDAVATQIGITAAEAGEMTNLTQQARAAYGASQEARNAAKAATQTFYDGTSDMATYGASLIAKIRAFAETTNNPAVYNLAQIPPPATPSAVPPPGTPFEFTVGLLQDGAVELNWKCTNPSGTYGTIYEVMRQIGGPSAPMTFIGATGVRTFIDATLPAGSTPCTYKVTAVRSTSRGNPAQFTVNFGVGGGGGGRGFAVTNVTEPQPVRMAA